MMNWHMGGQIFPHCCICKAYPEGDQHRTNLCWTDHYRQHVEAIKAHALTKHLSSGERIAHARLSALHI